MAAVPDYDYPYDYDDNFEADFADELEVLDEMEDIPGFKPSSQEKSKRSLKFSTPKDKGEVKLNGTSVPAEDRQTQKRDLSAVFELPETDEEDNVVSSASKKRRVMTVDSNQTDIQDADDDDFEITPPSSPNIIAKVQQYRETTGKTADQSAPQAREQVTSGRPAQSKSCFLRRPPSGKFVTVTNEDGERMYLKEHEDTLHDSQKLSGHTLPGGRPLQLLSVSFRQLKDQVEDERRRKIVAESERITREINRQLDRDLGTEDEEDGGASDQEDAGKSAQTGLWVDKFTPTNYTELLSDEGTNRTLLTWLKLWDTAVFGRERKVKKKPADQKKGQFINWQAKRLEEELVQDEDGLKRPQKKVALLCGPPGLGKTTLAHVIARHAGYNVVEMNASDDRSAEVFKERIEAATQMKAVMGADPRPNCLVIDEIDGAPQAAINVLLDIIKRKDQSGEAGPQGKRRRRRREGGVLLRPIICICNDLYVLSLRRLRPLSLVLHFPPTDSTRLAGRLLEIARRQSVRTDMTTLLALCEKTEKDIRSCVNTLQFVHSRGTDLSLSDVRSMAVGQKDQQKGLFTVWQQIFQVPRQKRKRWNNPHDVAAGQQRAGEDVSVTQPHTPAGRFQHILHLTSGNGEYEKTCQGLFENYLEAKFKDTYLDAVTMGCDWLGFYDLVNNIISHIQTFILMRYIPYTFVAFHMLFAGSTAPKLSYPSSQYECHQKMTETQSLRAAQQGEMSAVIRSRVSQSAFLLELLPALLDIIQPSFRPVNSQLFSAKEKQQMSDLIHTMIAYNLTYQQERSPEGQYQYLLEPNMEEATRFSDQPPKKQLTYAAKQLIAKEIEVEKMRRSEALLMSRNRNVPTPEEKTQETGQKSDGTAEGAVPNHLAKLQPKKITVAEEKPAVDFFGRVIKKKTPERNKDASSSNSSSSQKVSREGMGTVYYKFNEGVSNAIRKNIPIQDLL
ncbi:PREDICTED: LOW QUALITY PROTEIN: chromosome transmission fidelity protein 18 homolog [Branchiostoma belcheri]|uniref:LOW QUALITY PROTEIN: chromosome transmission fidelity protein 18 homolog n=1 Tax=Branchiostoma belcheri TaxID=7741 RepID=A0A6P4Y5R2_BRABE|nr:PREDICTED: LOW QUALITY PROTEIN: chromosome transmission fidelity protein 18 homolog [Branchiostoma belcheri]